MQASDRFNINSQLEHLQAKYVGTGHADQGRFEWAVNINRDSYAMFIGRHSMLAYIAISENESIGRERYNFMQKSQSCGRMIRGSRVTGPLHNNTSNASDTDTSGSDNSRTVSDENVSPPVRFSTCRTAEEEVVVYEEESSDPSKTPSYYYIPDYSDTDTSRIVSDNEPYRDNISNTANTVSNTPISQSVQSNPCQIVEAVLADQEEFSDPNSVSDTGPYHDNMPDTSYTEVSKTASDTPVSQSVPSSPCGIVYSNKALGGLKCFSRVDPLQREMKIEVF
ncbi:Splicing factor 3B subunit 10 (SF3b10) [Carex littledalei]|uniref:Splicing factor 3B subunit 10 (SF3b10) n=1 Tax=Carex littledalei TaxID=544730 RepID=A0A833VBU3_9POAL|nr:Splicing factor 3B subunit 10 (SF3b10) [Carex littledalei]